MSPKVYKSLENEEDMRLITVHFPPGILKKLDALVEEQYFPNRSEAIRSGVYFMLISMGNILVDDPHATNAQLFRLFQDFVKKELADESLDEVSIHKTKMKMKKHGLPLSKEDVEAIDHSKRGKKRNTNYIERDKEIARLYAEGKDVETIADMQKMKYGAVYWILKRDGLYVKKSQRFLDKPEAERPPPKFQIDKVKCARKECDGCPYFKLDELEEKQRCHYGEDV